MIDLNITDTHLKFNGNFSKGNSPKFIVLHHAAISECTIEDINSWHKARGWAGCGYHYFITKDGEVFRGRDDDVIGAHCKNHNKNSLGICLEGNFMNEELTEIQKDKLQELCRELVIKYNIKSISGHRELGPTECPGDNFPLDEIRKGIMKNIPENQNKYCGYLLKINPHKYDEEVKKVQEKLIELGYGVGVYGADGYFGNYTYLAVLHFQQEYHLLVDGIVGPETWKVLF
ncbi:peptidoglycan recognition protein family protein [Clostridium sp. DL1XJH146]